MKTYEIEEKEYHKLKNKIPFKTTHELTEGDRIFVLKGSKINLYYLDEYLENNYNDVLTTTDILNANVILGNINNFNYVVDIGYKYENVTFRNEEQWNLYISRNTFKPSKVPPREETPLLSEAYNKEEVYHGPSFDKATPIYYINIFCENLDIETIMFYNDGMIKTIDESVLIRRIESANKQYEIDTEDVNDIFDLLRSKKKHDINAAITSIKKMHRDSIITKIIPIYYSDNIERTTKELLYNEILSKLKNITELLIEPNKASYSYYERTTESLRRIQYRTKLEFDKNILIKCFLNE